MFIHFSWRDFLLYSAILVKNAIRSVGDPSSKKMKTLVQRGLQASKIIFGHWRQIFLIFTKFTFRTCGDSAV